MFLLVITHPTGQMELRTFPTACDRALAQIMWRLQPVTLRTAEA